MLGKLSKIGISRFSTSPGSSICVEDDNNKESENVYAFTLFHVVLPPDKGD